MHFVDAHSHCAPTPEQPWRLQNVLWQERELVAQISTPCSLGIHPWFPPAPGEVWQDAMRESVRHPQVRALGEAGIDRVRSPISLEAQTEIFKDQAILAEEFKKPLILHSVRSASDILRCHKAWNPGQTWILHGFQESPEMAMALVKRGMCLSFGHALLDVRRAKLALCLKQVPTSHLLLESDEHPDLLPEIAQRAAEIRGISIEELLILLQANWRRFFGAP